jgi:hypothetical protein
VNDIHAWLQEHPEDGRLAGNLDFLARVVMEALRLHPATPNIGRVAEADVALASGETIHRGQWVACMHMPANSDTTVFGKDASKFDPHRSVAQGVPRYGTTFGTGAHQCLGLRMVLGNDGVGGHAYILKALLEAGVQPDPDLPPDLELSERQAYSRFPVQFVRL